VSEGGGHLLVMSKHADRDVKVRFHLSKALKNHGMKDLRILSTFLVFVQGF
jgi:hypothetical protein